MTNYRSYAKALVPLVLGVVAVLAEWLVSGVLDHVALDTAIAAIVTALTTFAVPNGAIVPPPRG